MGFFWKMSTPTQPEYCPQTPQELTITFEQRVGQLVFSVCSAFNP